MRQIFPAWLRFSAALAAALLLLSYADAAFMAAKDALLLCASRVVPALFPFYIVTSLLLQSDQPASRAMRTGGFFPRLRGGVVCFLLGAVAGYPSGARLAARFGGEDLAAFCNLSSPIFLYSVVAVSFCNEPRMFAPLALAHYGSALLLTLLDALLRRPENGSPRVAFPNEPSREGRPLPELIADAAFAMLKICGCVVFFSVVSRILSALLFGGEAALPDALLSGLLEVTNGTAKTAALALPARQTAALMAFLVSFGGVSVAMQTLVTAPNVRLGRYLLLKLSHAFLAGGAAYCLSALFLPESVQTAFASPDVMRQNALVLFAYVFVSLTGMCAMYLAAQISKLAGEKISGPRSVRKSVF